MKLDQGGVEKRLAAEEISAEVLKMMKKVAEVGFVIYCLCASHCTEQCGGQCFFKHAKLAT